MRINPRELVDFVQGLRDKTDEDRIGFIQEASSLRDGTAKYYPVKMSAAEREQIAAIMDRGAAKRAEDIRLHDALLEWLRR